jgi:hypothetical protein
MRAFTGRSPKQSNQSRRNADDTMTPDPATGALRAAIHLTAKPRANFSVENAGRAYSMTL